MNAGRFTASFNLNWKWRARFRSLERRISYLEGKLAGAENPVGWDESELDALVAARNVLIEAARRGDLMALAGEEQGV